MVSVKINFKKKDLWLLSAIVVFMVGVGYVIAEGANPAVHGHPVTAGFTIDDNSVPLIFKESDTTGAGSLWRLVLDGKDLRFDASPNGVNFTGYITPLRMDSSGSITTVKDLIVTGTCTGCGGGTGGSLAFGAWQDVSAAASGGAVQGPAASDGFVLAYTPSVGGGVYDIFGYTDSTTNPTRLVIRHKSGAVYAEDPSQHITMPVKKGDYWKLAGTIEKVYWLPVVSGSSGLDLTNCAWTGWGICTAGGASNQLICPSEQVVRGYQRTGCTSASPPCDDSTRCEKVQLYCCG